MPSADSPDITMITNLSSGSYERPRHLVNTEP